MVSNSLFRDLEERRNQKIYKVEIWKNVENMFSGLSTETHTFSISETHVLREIVRPICDMGHCQVAVSQYHGNP